MSSLIASPTYSQRNIKDYYRESTPDYAFWSQQLHMHFGFYDANQPWSQVFDLEKMLAQMSEEVFSRLRLTHHNSPTIEGYRIADLGCGVGTSTMMLAKKLPTSQVYGVSITPEQIDLAINRANKKNLNNVDFLCADYTSNPLPSNSFDAVYAIESSCHAEGKDKRAFLEESHRLLQSGGRIVIADGFLKHGKKLPSLIKRTYQKTCECWALPEMGQIEPFVERMKKLGFTDILVEDISWKVAPSVAYVPLVTLKFLMKYLKKWNMLSQERRNNVFAPLMTMILGLARKHFSYYIISATKQ